MKGKSFGDTIKLLWVVTGRPATARVTLLIEAPVAGRTRIRALKTTDGTVAELPPAEWSRPFLDTDLAYEDPFDERRGTRDCYVVTSAPGQGNGLTTRRSFRGSTGNAFSGFRESGGIWGARQIGVRAAGAPPEPCPWRRAMPRRRISRPGISSCAE